MSRAPTNAQRPWPASRQQGGIWNTPQITCRCAFNAMFRINCVAPSNPGYSVELSPFSRRARSLRLRICSPLHDPTVLRQPGSRCDIDSHPDCRPFLTLIVAPQTESIRRDRLDRPLASVSWSVIPAKLSRLRFAVNGSPTVNLYNLGSLK